MKTFFNFISICITVFYCNTSIAQLSISSGTKGEIYNQFAKDIANNTNVNLKIFTSGGSIDNFNKLISNNVQIAFLQYDVLLYKELENPDIKKYIKILLPLYDEEIHLITKNNDAINSLSDLKNKNVGIGSINSGTYITAKFIKYKTSIKWRDYDISFDKCLNALLHDSIDAFFYVGAAPSNLLKSLSAGLKNIIKLVEIDDKQLEDFYKPKMISENTYPWMSKDINTFSVKSLLAVNIRNISEKQSEQIDLLYDDLKGNLKGIQKNKLSHHKWESVDFSDMDGVDWPVYKEKYISLDYFSMLIAYLAALLSLIQIYFIINKLWKRKHEKIVAESISISAMFISIIINSSFAFKNFHDGGVPQFSANLMWILASSVSALIGMGLFVSMNKNLGFFALLSQALKLEKKEAGNLAKIFFRPFGADKIIEILGRMAMVDGSLDKREKDYIQSFADHWEIEIDWETVQQYSLESGDRYEKIKLAMANYLSTNPQEEQVNQLRDVFNILINIDDVVTEEEQLILAELEGQIAEYLNKQDLLEIYRVAVVPQSKEQEEAVSKLLTNLNKEKIAGGFAYLSVPYYSERYAEIISSQYRVLHIFSIVINPKHLKDENFLTKMLDDSKNEV